MLNASPRQGKVPGTTSGRYLLLEIDPKDRQVDPAGCHSLPLLPHVWNNRDSDQVSKIPPDVKLWQWRVLESSSHILTWSSKCQHSRGTGFGTWDLKKVPKELLGGGRRRGDNVRMSPTILISRPSVNLYYHWFTWLLAHSKLWLMFTRSNYRR